VGRREKKKGGGGRRGGGVGEEMNSLGVVFQLDEPEGSHDGRGGWGEGRRGVDDVGWEGADLILPTPPKNARLQPLPMVGGGGGWKGRGEGGGK